MKINPETRGIENEIPTESPKKEMVQKQSGKPLPDPLMDQKIVKVLSHGPGWIAVEMGNGKKMKRWDGSLAWRHNNVGNIKFGDFAKTYGAVGEGQNGLAVFPTVEHARKAHKDLLFTPIRNYHNMSLIDACRKYAPYADNNDPDAYAHYVAKAARVSFMKVLKNFTEEEKERALSAFEKMEGYFVGKVGEIK